MTNIVTAFQETYDQLNKDKIYLLKDIYSSDFVFVDPFQKIEGLSNYENHCQSLYTNVLRCNFQFMNTMVVNDKAYTQWIMEFAHPKLRGGESIFVNGTSYLEFSKKITLHVDYFDGGQFLYENIPFIRHAIAFLKKRVSS